MTNTTISIRYTGSVQVFSAPQGMNEQSAVLWAGRLYHSSVKLLVKKLDDTHYEVSNRRRGLSRRCTIIEVVR